MGARVRNGTGPGGAVPAKHRAASRLLVRTARHGGGWLLGLGVAGLGLAAAETALPAVEKLLKDPSPLVRGAAVWALSRLAPNQVAQRQRMSHETDAGVCAEWNAARNIREQRTGP